MGGVFYIMGKMFLEEVFGIEMVIYVKNGIVLCLID